MPTADPAGWTEVFSDDFTGTSIAADRGWWTYYGKPGSDTDGWWDPSHDVMSNGELKLEGYKDPIDDSAGEPAGAYVTGGVKMRLSQTYGKYLVRFRMDQGLGISLAALLWPTGAWPPEVDFAEDNGASPRTLNTATLHYGPGNHIITQTTAVNMTQWHTLGVEWTPGRLVYTLDGQDWATVTNSNVPSAPMTLALQTQSHGCQDSVWEFCPTATTPAEVDMDIDWVVVYKQAGS